MSFRTGTKYDLEHDRNEEAEKKLKTVMSHLYHSKKYSDSLHELEESGLVSKVKILIDSIKYQKAYEEQLNEIIKELQDLVNS